MKVSAADRSSLVPVLSTLFSLHAFMALANVRPNGGAERTLLGSFDACMACTKGLMLSMCEESADAYVACRKC